MSGEIRLIIANTVARIVASTATTSLGGGKGRAFRLWDVADASPEALRSISSPSRHFVVALEDGIELLAPTGQLTEWTDLRQGLRIDVVYPTKGSPLELIKILAEDAVTLTHELGRLDNYDKANTNLINRTTSDVAFEATPADGDGAPVLSMAVTVHYRPGF